jgi:Na+/H+ antiporter NhaD/arsenite permease-like protein
VFRGVAVFALTYVLIAGPRWQRFPLDRAAAALLGAVLAITLGVLSPAAALAAIDGKTLVLLFGLMGVGAFLIEGDLLLTSATRLTAWARTPQRLLGAVVWAAGGLSALITNDAVCVIFAPVIVDLVERHRLPPLPFLLALATAANTGSVATLVGNPQNLLCASLGGLDYRGYAFHLVPVAVMGLAVNHALLALAFRRPLRATHLSAVRAYDPPPLAPDTAAVSRTSAARTLLVLTGTVGVYLAGADLALTAVGGFVALLLIQRVDPTRFWARIDWSVLVFFAGLFIVVEAFVQSGAAAFLLTRFPIFTGSDLNAYVRTATVFLVGSNLVSNVPFILVVKDAMAVFPNPTLAWELLAMASTFAGNLTLLGSVANIIVAERGRSIGGLPFFAYLRVGLPLALITTALGTAWLLMVHGVFR